MRMRNCTALALLFVLTAASGSEPTGCPDFEVEPPRAGQRGRMTVKAVDFGLSGQSERNHEAINAALREAKRVGAARVELAPGIYRCFDGKGIDIDGFTDFTFDGKGATLVFRRDHAPLERQADQLVGEANVEIRNCRRTLVENFNMDWDWRNDPLAVWARCVGKHEDAEDGKSYADFELDRPHPKYPEHVPVNLLTQMSEDRNGAVMDGKCRHPGYFGSSLGHIGTKSEWLSPSRLRIWPFVKPDYGYFATEALGRFGKGKNRDFTSEIEVGGTYVISHAYYGLNGFVLTSNRHLTLRNIDIWACKGFGVETRGAQKSWQLVDFNIRPKPGEKYPCTSSADAHHVAQSLGYGKMIGCEVTMHQDDHFNYHDRTQIGWKRGARTVEIVNSRGVGYTLFKPGSKIALRQEDFGGTGWTGMITEIDGNFISFDRDLPEQKGMLFVLMDAEYATENFIFRDCRFHGSPWSRGLFNGNNATFENCSFGPMVGRPLFLLSCYTYNVWCEGIGCTNIIVRNCRFENCLDVKEERGVSAQIMSEIAIPPSYDPERFTIANAELAAKVAANKASGRKVVPADDALGSILIEGCTFVNPRGYLWAARNGSDMIFRRNRVVWGNPPFKVLPCAGKVLVEGGADNLVEPPVSGKPRLAFQVYAVRDLCEKNFTATLKAVKSLGYEGVETGRFYGLGAEELKALLDETGLKLVALQLYPDDLAGAKLRRTLEFAKDCGADRINVAWFKGGFENFRDWQLLVEVVNHAAVVAAEEGITIGYHNHDQEFKIKFDGKYVWDWLWERFSPLVKQEFDAGWCALAGADPLEVIKRYPGMNPTVHIMPAIRDTSDLKPGEAGVGSQRDSVDWPRLLSRYSSEGTGWLVVKPVAFPGSTDDLKASAEYLKTLGYK